MKNEELNLAELLQDVPIGTKFYCTVIGEVEFRGLDYDSLDIFDEECNFVPIDNFGRYSRRGECVLFPSKDQRDWDVWKEEQDKKNESPFKIGDYAKDRNGEIYKIIELKGANECVVHYLTEDVTSPAKCECLTKIDKYPISRFQPFDKVLCRHLDKDNWKAQFFSHIDTGDREYPFYATFSYRYCIPYNSETKHLVGTTKEAPEFYINWEEE